MDVCYNLHLLVTSPGNIAWYPLHRVTYESSQTVGTLWRTHKYFSLAENPTHIPRSCSLYPSNYSDWAISALIFGKIWRCKKIVSCFFVGLLFKRSVCIFTWRWRQ